MNKCIVVLCSIAVLIGLLLAFHVLFQMSLKLDTNSEQTLDLPTFNSDFSANYCRTPSCVVATSKLHVIPFQ